MALTYDGSNGIFTRLGKLFGMADAVRTHQLDLKTRMLALQAEYSDADFHMIAGLLANMEARLQATGAILGDIQQACVNTLVETCYEDSLVSTRGVLPEKNVEQALLYLQREMVADSETVDRTTISKSAVAAGSGNTGNGTLLFSELPPLAMAAGGTQYPHCRSERIEVRCVQDAQDGSIRAGEERFELRGWAAYPNLDYRFPAGSGVRMRMAAVHAGVDSGARYENQLRNSNFESFTSNLPDGWTAVTGSAGTHFAQETSIYYRGASALKFIGDGSNLTKIRQQLGSVDGTPNTIVADRLYCLTAVVRVNGSASAGVIRFSLEDSGGTEVSSTGMTQSYTVGTTYARVTTYFRAPLALPSTVYAVVELTTALNSGGIFYIDELVLVEMQQIAAGGVGIVLAAGNTNFVANDALRLLVTNNGEGLINTAMDRMFRLYETGVVLPNSAAPTILDSLIS